MKPLITILFAIALITQIFSALTLVKNVARPPVKERRLSMLLQHNTTFINTIKGMREKLGRMLTNMSLNKRDAFIKLDHAIGRLDLGTGGMDVGTLMNGPSAAASKGPKAPAEKEELEGRLRYKKVV